MGMVLFKFVGICTHVQGVQLEVPHDAIRLRMPPAMPPAAVTRVVLPDASLGYRWYDKEIPAHDAVLSIERRFIVSTSGPLQGLEELDRDACTWRMRGVQLYATEATENLVKTRELYGRLPSLTAKETGPVELDLRVVLDGNAAAVVDLYGGTRSAEQSEQALTGIFEVPTESQRLAVVRMRDQSRGYIQLKNADDGTSPCVSVRNTGRKADVSEDFLLHYLTTTWRVPRDWKPPLPNYDGVPEANEIEKRLYRDEPQGLTYGCSNSNYP